MSCVACGGHGYVETLTGPINCEQCWLYRLSVKNINLHADDIRDARPQFISKSARKQLLRAINAHRDAFPDLVSKHGV